MRKTTVTKEFYSPFYCVYPKVILFCVQFSTLTCPLSFLEAGLLKSNTSKKRCLFLIKIIHSNFWEYSVHYQELSITDKICGNVTKVFTFLMWYALFSLFHWICYMCHIVCFFLCCLNWNCKRHYEFHLAVVVSTFCML